MLLSGETEEAQRLSQLAPRLWPFLSHTNRRVRLSCLRVLLSLLESGQRKNRGGGRGGDSEGGERSEGGEEMERSEGGEEMERREAVEEGGEVTEEGMEMERSETGEEKRPTWLGAVLQGALCHLFQRLALEGDKENTDLALQVMVRL